MSIRMVASLVDSFVVSEIGGLLSAHMCGYREVGQEVLFEGLVNGLTPGLVLIRDIVLLLEVLSDW